MKAFVNRKFGKLVIAGLLLGSLLSMTACATFTGEYSNYTNVNGDENSLDINVSADSDGFDVDVATGEEALTQEEQQTTQGEQQEDPLDENGMVDVLVPDDYVAYEFRNDKLLTQHYEKHGEEMGFASAEEYEEAAAKVVNNPNVLHKTEEEDGDDVYYLEDTNEFVVVSTDGYIRTYFCPDAGIDYFNRQ